MKKAVFPSKAGHGLRKSSNYFLTKNLIINGDPSYEKLKESLRMTRTLYLAEPFTKNRSRLK